MFDFYSQQCLGFVDFKPSTFHDKAYTS